MVFQTLDPTSFRTIEELERGFTASFSKIGMKHDELSRIYGFKQEKGESVRDCAARLRQYLIRCPQADRPTQQRLVSVFLEGLLDKTMHATLYMKHHTDLNQCILDAIDFEDNCNDVSRAGGRT